MNLLLEKTICLFFIFCGSTTAQTTYSNLSASIEFTPYFEKAFIKIHSDTDSILNVSIQIKDQQKTVIKTQKLPNEYRYIKSSIDLLSLLPGKYTFVILKDSVELHSKAFIKDETLSEPQKIPVIHNEK